MPSARSIAEIVASMQAVDPTSPRLTWYGPDGERVELSGRVLANWVIKATNLLVSEGEVGPGSVVVVDLPVHWRALVWSVAAWLAGAQVQLLDDGGSGPVHPDVVVTWRPSARPAEVGVDLSVAGTLVAVSLPALAMVFDGDLPSGAIDGSADLMTYPDVLIMPGVVDPDASALDDLEHERLVEWALGGVPPAVDGPPLRVLLATHEPILALRAGIGAWAHGGSLVLVGDGREAEALARVAQVENAML